jgi:hypothetical protein
VRRRSSVGSLGVLALALVALAAPPCAAEPAVAGDAVARGDAAYARRGEGQEDGRAAPGPIAEAVAAYEEAVHTTPANLEAHWKLVRALFFQSEYVTTDTTSRRRILSRGVDLGRDAESRLAASIGDATRFERGTPDEVAAALRGNPDAAPVCFWSAVVYASWGRVVGPLFALREGLAERLRRQAEIVIALDPTYEAGGAHRLLGRIHAEVPRLPFVTPWVHRERALAELRRAFALAPDHPWNQLLLGMTLLELAPAEKPKALELLHRVASGSPRPEFVVEDVGIERMARDLIAQAGDD